MDFDEYEYLEKTVEKPELPKDKPPATITNGTPILDEKDKTRTSRHHDDGDLDSNHRSKRSRSEPDRRRERSSSRHRSSPDRDRDRHRNGRDSDRDRDRDRERYPDRERAKERERLEREKERERERERSRRSRSRSERHREEERSRRERSRDEFRERDYRERELRERDHESRRYKGKKEEVTEPEADPERDQRTVFAYQIALKAEEREVYEFFSRAGKVRDVRLIMDRNSRRSKGVGYIEFYDALSVPMAIALSGQPLLGQPVMVKPSEAEKNLAQSTAAVGLATGFIGPYSGGARRLYIGNLHFSITEDQLRLVFEPFGPVELVQLPREADTGHCKGYGFIQFARLEDARAALSLNGQLNIAGRSIKVSAVTDQVGMQDVGVNAGDFDDDEGGGLSLNARSRALLMQKLDRSDTTSTSVAGAVVSPVVSTPLLATATTSSVLGIPPAISPLLQVPAGLATPGILLPTSALPVVSTAVQPVDATGVPTECLLLKNMFDPNVETEPDFDLDIKEDVEEECTKFGTVKHIFVDKNTAGYVYLRFDTTTSAMSAQRALHGRWFAGKMITATFMTPQNYEAKFPSRVEAAA